MLVQMALSVEHGVRSFMICCNIVVTKTLPNCTVIFSQPVLRMDIIKAALTLHHLNEHFSQLNLDVVDNINIKVKHY